ncbi:MAG: CusA/CzcA family heavy metal efflux RND transporter [Thermoanaerobaculales bacterium]|jgi:cobalt-zinc-cadmium resistance protein CzcA|nr:CusA/CzcA family heavy metal efflux RND transporter [Thermoanaerobaculales bacterium]
MRRLIELSLGHRLVVILLAALLIGAGWRSFRALPIDAFPDVTNIQVTVISQAATLSPLEIEQLVTYPIEQALAGLPHSTELRSLSKFGLSMVTVVFEDGTDIYFARQLVLERIFTVAGELPEGTSSSLGPISTGLGEVFQYTLESDRRDLMELRGLQDWVLRPILRTVPGVAGVDSFGGHVRQFHVVANPVELRRFDLTLDELATAVEANNGVAGGAFVERGGEQFVVRGDGWVRSAEDLEETVVAYRSGVPVLLRQVAAVEVAPEIRQGAITRDGRGETVAGIVLMLRGGSGREVVAGVKEKLAVAGQSLPADVEVVPFYDRDELVRTALGTVESALLQGAALVVLVLLFFMGHVRSAVLVAIQLPVAALATFLAMDLVGMSSNLMTLSGLAIAIGMLGDGAIVLVENAVRLLGREGAEAEDRSALILRAAVEVARPIVFGVAVIIVVFLPIATLQGLEGKMFAPLAFTISIALGCALLLSMTLIPVLASLLLRPAPVFGGGRVPHPADLVRRVYCPQLRWALDHPRVVAGVALGLLLVAAVIVPTLGTEFLPSMDEGSIVVQPFQIPSVSLTQALDTVTRIERAIMELPEVVHVVSRTGRSDISSDPMGVGESDVYVILRPRSEWTTADTKAGLVDAIRHRMAEIPGVEFGYTQPIQMRVDELLSGVKSQIAVKVFGDDLHELATTGERIAAVLGEVEGAVDVKVEAVEGLGYLEIAMNRRRLARLGISVASVRSLIETAIGGRVVTTVPEGDRRTDVVVRLPQAFTANVDNLRELPLATPAGERVLLREVADFRVVEGPAQISRENGKRRVVVELNVVGRDIGGFVAEARGRIADEVELPVGSFVTWGGQFEQQQRAMARLKMMVPVALVFIFILLFLNFRDTRAVLLILANIPLALVGGVFGLKLFGMYLSVSASVGFIALFGIAILNALVMVEFFRTLEGQGRGRREAVLEGAEMRLRPVLMTAATTALGLLPMVWASGVGSEVQRPLAVVVVFGVVTSTLLTLMVLPVLYDRLGSKP